MPPNYATSRKGRTFTAEEITKIVETARRFGPPARRQTLAALFAFMAHYGARISEALLLTWGAVDFERGEIRLRTLKRKKVTFRTLPLLKPVAVELLPLRNAAPPEEPIFKLSRRVAYNLFQVILHDAGLPRARLHDLRHSFLSNLLERTRDLPLVRDWVGHSSIDVTDTYLHPIRMREKADEMGGVYQADRTESPLPRWLEQFHPTHETGPAPAPQAPEAEAPAPEVPRVEPTGDGDNGQPAPPGTFREMERALILLRLHELNGHMNRTARSLGIGRTTLWRKMREYGIRQTWVAEAQGGEVERPAGA